MKRYGLLAFVALLTLLLAACTQATPTPTPTKAPAATPTPTRPAATPPSTPTTAQPTATTAPAPTPTPTRPAAAATSTPAPTASPTAAPSAQTGTVEVRVTDAPPEGVTKVLITASKIEAQRSGAEGESGWTTIVEAPPVFDLVAVTGLEDVLGSASLPVGAYTQVRLAVTKVVVTVQGKDQEATVPSDKLRVVGGLEVAAGKTTVLTLDFDADKSVVLAGDKAQFKPVVKLLTKAPTDKPEPPKRTSIAIALLEQNASGQTGVAVLTARGNRTEVQLKATAGISQANHIHTGSCATLGGVKYPLTNMADGASLTTVDVKLDDLLAGGFAVNLHKIGQSSVYTACGDIPAKDKVVSVYLTEQNASGQRGTATLIAQGDKTAVVLWATAGISQANHIHTGSCATLGGVKYPLTNMADGMSVTVVDVKLDDLRTGAFAVNLHKIGQASVYTACGDIPTKALAAAGAGGTTTTPATVEATIQGFQLPNLTVPAGTTVKWTNQDSTGHTISSGKDGKYDGVGFNSGTISQSGSFIYTFKDAGTFTYTCARHSSMNGTITVTPGGSGSSASMSSDGSGEPGYSY